MGKKLMIAYDIQSSDSQKASTQKLIAALCEERFPQALLIDGPKGIGKKKLAMQIMQALMCTHPEKRPCGNCFGCKLALTPGASENWLIPLTTEETNKKTAIEISSKSKAETRESITVSYIEKIFQNPYDINYLASGAIINVELIRSLNARFSLKENAVRCVIIPEAEKMNIQAANAFLKTLEEVPKNTYFILTTISRDLLLATIRSRCSAIRLEHLENDELKKEFFNATQKEISPDVLGFALGSLGRALFFDELEETLTPVALNMITDSFQKNFSNIILKLQDTFLKSQKDSAGLETILIFLDVLNFILTDITRYQSGVNLRMPIVSSKLPKEILEQMTPTLVQNALLKVQDTAKKIADKITSPQIALTALAIRLFDGER